MASTVRLTDDASMAAYTQTEDLCTCSICLEIYRDPHLLPCGHSLCAKCLDKLTAKPGPGSKMVVECPECRKPHQIERRSSDETKLSEYFPKNFQLATIAHFVQSKTSANGANVVTRQRAWPGSTNSFDPEESSKSGYRLCGVCFDAVPTHTCRECNIDLCNSCRISHIREGGSHTVLPCPLLPGGADLLLPQSTSLCNHGLGSMKSCCMTCYRVVCTACKCHRCPPGASTDLVADVVSEHKSALTAEASRLRQYAASVELTQKKSSEAVSEAFGNLLRRVQKSAEETKALVGERYEIGQRKCEEARRKAESLEQRRDTMSDRELLRERPAFFESARSLSQTWGDDHRKLNIEMKTALTKEMVQIKGELATILARDDLFGRPVFSGSDLTDTSLDLSSSGHSNTSSGPPSSRSGPPSVRSDPPSGRSGPPSSKSGPSSARSAGAGSSSASLRSAAVTISEPNVYRAPSSAITASVAPTPTRVNQKLEGTAWKSGSPTKGSPSTQWGGKAACLEGSTASNSIPIRDLPSRQISSGVDHLSSFADDFYSQAGSGLVGVNGNIGGLSNVGEYSGEAGEGDLNDSSSGWAGVVSRRRHPSAPSSAQAGTIIDPRVVQRWQAGSNTSPQQYKFDRIVHAKYGTYDHYIGHRRDFRILYIQSVENPGEFILYKDDGNILSYSKLLQSFSFYSGIAVDMFASQTMGVWERKQKKEGKVLEDKVVKHMVAGMTFFIHKMRMTRA